VNRRSWWLAGGLSVFLAVVQLRLVMTVLGANFLRSADVAHGVLDGTPHWRIYQNRIIGPYLAEGLSAVMPSYAGAVTLLSLIALVASGVLAWRIGARRGGDRGGLLAVVVMHLAFAFLLWRRWLFIWDFFDLAMFLLFVDFVIAEKKWQYFVPLGVIGVLNHEVALFISGFLVIDPIAKWLLGKLRNTPVPFDRMRCLVGVLAAAVSLQLVERVRDALLVQATGNLLFTDAPANANDSFQFQLFDNLDIIRQVVTSWDWGLTILIPVLLVATLGVLVWIAKQDPAKYLGLALTFAAVIASLLTFGALIETRIYVVLIPVYVLATTLMPRVDD
jgi:hypothetical protein